MINALPRWKHFKAPQKEWLSTTVKPDFKFDGARVFVIKNNGLKTIGVMRCVNPASHHTFEVSYAYYSWEVNTPLGAIPLHECKYYALAKPQANQDQ